MSKIEGYENIPNLKEQGKELLEQGNKEFITTKIDSYGMNILLFTSGTTSKSKSSNVITK